MGLFWWNKGRFKHTANHVGEKLIPCALGIEEIEGRIPQVSDYPLSAEQERYMENTGPKKSRLKKVKRILACILLALPFIYLGFIVADRLGIWDRLTGLNLVEKVATRFDLSYADDASSPVRVGDAEWNPLLTLVYRYSKDSFARDKTPRVFARFRASLSSRTPSEGPIFSEWTAPSTPIVLIYVEWPQNSGKSIPPDLFRVVGTIGDLHEWISKEKDRRRFWVQDIFLGTFGPLLAIVVFWLERQIKG